MTRMQRNWMLATALAGALFACAIALVVSGLLDGAASRALGAALAAWSFGMVLFAARETRRP